MVALGKETAGALSSDGSRTQLEVRGICQYIPLCRWGLTPVSTISCSTRSSVYHHAGAQHLARALQTGIMSNLHTLQMGPCGVHEEGINWAHVIWSAGITEPMFKLPSIPRSWRRCRIMEQDSSRWGARGQPVACSGGCSHPCWQTISQCQPHQPQHPLL